MYYLLFLQIHHVHINNNTKIIKCIQRFNYNLRALLIVIRDYIHILKTAFGIFD